MAVLLLAACEVGVEDGWGDDGDPFADAVDESDDIPYACNVPCVNDVTARLRVLGNPLAAAFPSGDAIYARNVWDLQLYNNRIYIGHGNSSNIAPAPNAGPVKVWYWDPGSATFRKDSGASGTEYTLSEEQIDIFRVIGTDLVIPGHDPSGGQSWDLGNFYRRTAATGWTKVRTIPDAVHTYDMLRSGTDLFAAIGTANGGAITRSRDNGTTWSKFTVSGGRVYTLFTLGGRLYASQTNGAIKRYTGSGFTSISHSFFTGAPSGTSGIRIVRPRNFSADQLIYIGGRKENDHQWSSQGLWVATSPSSVRRVALPDGSLPRDIMVRSGVAYVLSNVRLSSTQYAVKVFASRDLDRWDEILQFRAETFARSFETLNGAFYFGLGCGPSVLPASTGRIVRVAAADVAGF